MRIFLRFGLIFSLFIFFLSDGLAGAAQSSPRVTKITAKEAKELVARALERQPVSRLPSFFLDQFNNDRFGDFYFFDGLWDNPSEGGASAESYAVDKSTGDVWDAIVCREFKSASLRKLQTTIRRLHGIRKLEYRRLRKLGPMCEPGERPDK